MRANLPRSTRSRSAMARALSTSSVFSRFQKWKLVPSPRCNATRTFSSTVRLGNTAEIWNERITPRRATSAGFSRVMSWPLKRIVPRVGCRNLVSRLKVVVLPAPLGPISAWMVPRPTRRSTSSTATKPLNSFVRPRVSRMVSPDMGGAGAFLVHVAADDRGNLVAIEVVDGDVRVVPRVPELQAQRALFTELPGGAHTRFAIPVVPVRNLGGAREGVLVLAIDRTQPIEDLQLWRDRVLYVAA